MPDYVKECVNLKSYSKSKGYEGFFCLSEKMSFESVNEAINIFFDFWGVVGEQALLFSNATLDGDFASLVESYGYTQRDIDHHLKPVIEKGMLNLDNSVGDQYDWGTFGSMNASLSDFDYIYSLFFIVMNLGGVYGHVFLSFSGKNIVLYPHDDCGFGVISTVKDNVWVERFFALVDSKGNGKFEVNRNGN